MFTAGPSEGHHLSLVTKCIRFTSCDNSISGFPWQWQSGTSGEICLWNTRLPSLSLWLLRAIRSCFFFLYRVANSQSAESYPRDCQCVGLKHPCEATSLSYVLVLEVLIFRRFTNWANICFKLLSWCLRTAEGSAHLDLCYWLKHSPSLYFSEV